MHYMMHYVMHYVMHCVMRYVMCELRLHLPLALDRVLGGLLGDLALPPREVHVQTAGPKLGVVHGPPAASPVGLERHAPLVLLFLLVRRGWSGLRAHGGVGSRDRPGGRRLSPNRGRR